MENATEALHLSQEPRQEEVLLFDAKNRRYVVHVGGEVVVSLFSHNGFPFSKKPGSKVQRLATSDWWSKESMILANQKGEWVMTAEPGTPVQILDGITPQNEKTEADQLTQKDASEKSLTKWQYAARAAVFSALALGGTEACLYLFREFSEGMAAAVSVAGEVYTGSWITLH
jgi:hypothetical protein